MNSATRSSKSIAGDSFSIFCDEDAVLLVASYALGVFTEKTVTYSLKNNGLKEAVVPSTENGYYFIVSGRNAQILKKGNAEYKLFFIDGQGREDLELDPISYDENGDVIGMNLYEHLGRGIYSITPLVLSKSIVGVFGKLYSSFPNEISSDCPESEISASTVSISPTSQPTVITIGSGSANIKVPDSEVGISVGQTIFRI